LEDLIVEFRSLMSMFSERRSEENNVQYSIMKYLSL
jgi:hypothetical protein